MQTFRSILLVLCLALWARQLPAQSTWPQWLGPQRNGSTEGPTLVDRLPDDGLSARWIRQDLNQARSGGWSSPIVSAGRVYLFAHHRTKVAAGSLAATQYPYLPPEQRRGMSDEEYQEYERKRRDEQEARARNFSFDEVVYCLNANTGETCWEWSRKSVYTRFAQSSTPAIINDRLLYLGAGRTMRCLRLQPDRAELAWETRLPGEFRDEFLQSSVVVAGSVATVVCGDLFGVDLATGDIRWQITSPANQSGHSSPTVWRHEGRSLILANMGGGRTVCVDAEDGRQLWVAETQAGHATPLVVGDQLITYGNSRKKGLRAFRLSLTGAEPLWVYQGLADPGSTPVVTSDGIFIQGERRLACVDDNSGKARWTSNLSLSRPRYTSLIASDNKVIYGFEGLLVFAASDESYQPLWQGLIDRDGRLAPSAYFRSRLNMDELEKSAEGQREAERLWRKEFQDAGPLPCATPALVDGQLYVRLKRGIACYDLRRQGS